MFPLKSSTTPLDTHTKAIQMSSQVTQPLPHLGTRSFSKYGGLKCPCLTQGLCLGEPFRFGPWFFPAWVSCMTQKHRILTFHPNEKSCISVKVGPSTGLPTATIAQHYLPDCGHDETPQIWHNFVVRRWFFFGKWLDWIIRLLKESSQHQIIVVFQGETDTHTSFHHVCHLRIVQVRIII